VLRVVVVRVEPQATTEASLPDELILWNTLDECDESAVGVVPLSKYFRKGQLPIPFRCLSVKRINATVHDGVSWSLFPCEDERQMLKRLLFPQGDMGNNVFDRPSVSDTRLRHRRV